MKRKLKVESEKRQVKVKGQELTEKSKLGKVIVESKKWNTSEQGKRWRKISSRESLKTVLRRCWTLKKPKLMMRMLGLHQQCGKWGEGCGREGRKGSQDLRTYIGRSIHAVTQCHIACNTLPYGSQDMRIPAGQYMQSYIAIRIVNACSWQCMAM